MLLLLRSTSFKAAQYLPFDIYRVSIFSERLLQLQQEDFSKTIFIPLAPSMVGATSDVRPIFEACDLQLS